MAQILHTDKGIGSSRQRFGTHLKKAKAGGNLKKPESIG
jgi:hypothetical protein